MAFFIGTLVSENITDKKGFLEMKLDISILRKSVDLRYRNIDRVTSNFNDSVSPTDLYY